MSKLLKFCLIFGLVGVIFVCTVSIIGTGKITMASNIIVIVGLLSWGVFNFIKISNSNKINDMLSDAHPIICLAFCGFCIFLPWIVGYIGKDISTHSANVILINNLFPTVDIIGNIIFFVPDLVVKLLNDNDMKEPLYLLFMNIYWYLCVTLFTFLCRKWQIESFRAKRKKHIGWLKLKIILMIIFSMLFNGVLSILMMYANLKEGFKSTIDLFEVLSVTLLVIQAIIIIGDIIILGFLKGIIATFIIDIFFVIAQYALVMTGIIFLILIVLMFACGMGALVFDGGLSLDNTYFSPYVEVHPNSSGKCKTYYSFGKDNFSGNTLLIDENNNLFEIYTDYQGIVRRLDNDEPLNKVY